MSRREFSRAAKVEIIRRATRGGVIERCGLPTRRFEIDHVIAEALQIDKRARLTAYDGELLCSGSREMCHGRKTAEQDIPAIAKAKAREAAHVGARTRPFVALKSAQFPKSERSATRQPRPKATGPTAIERRFQRA
jgi:hypothetical protein